MSGTLELLAGPGGLSAGPFPADLGITLGIGDTEPVTIVLDDRVPAGPWDARISLHSGLLEGSAAATITFPDAGVSIPVNTRSTRLGWLYPVTAALVLLLLRGIGAVLLRRRRRRLPPTTEEPAPELSA
jgi:hypothetical protein